MTSSSPKVLFILKQRMPGPYGSWSYSATGAPLSSGLFISALQMTKMLDELKITNKLVHVVDNNGIDREVHQFKPTHVIIEAFWVVPEKFDVLKRLHPKVTWIVRNHSKPMFLANEGGMIGWAIDYMKRGVYVGSNSLEATRDFKVLARAADADGKYSVYLPNYYQASEPTLPRWRVAMCKAARSLGFDAGGYRTSELNIGCFGAVRPMKNHLMQAIASIELAEAHRMKLKFWINANRVEGKGDSFLRSLRELFARFPQHQLVELDWQAHGDFLETIAKMDIVLQVSNSETFNIVAADAVSKRVPVIGSDEIPWLNSEYHADPSSALDIAQKMNHVLRNRSENALVEDQLYDLRDYAELTKATWSRYLTGVPSLPKPPLNHASC